MFFHNLIFIPYTLMYCGKSKIHDFTGLNLFVLMPRQTGNKNQNSVSENGTSVSLLDKACDLIRNFPEYHDVVVSVARKTDGRHWADLFSAAGRSTEYTSGSFFLFFFLFSSNSLIWVLACEVLNSYSFAMLHVFLRVVFVVNFHLEDREHVQI